MSQEFKSGFVAIIGRPNVGKSTLLNNIIGQKIAIMSDKAQTTRNRIQGVYTEDNHQIVFIDTPGIHKPQHRLGEYMLKQTYGALDGVDCILVMVNAVEEIGPGDRFVIDRIRNSKVPVYLLINKVDLLENKEDLIGIIGSYMEEYDFDEVFPISALEGDNVEALIENLKELIPEGPQYYPADMVVDHPEHFIVSELIREKVLHLTREEIPHSVAVKVESMFRNEDDKVEISAVIVVERKSQKGIIIGKQGKMIKNIGTKARRDIEKLLGDKVYLDLFVKVDQKWRERPSQLDEYGYMNDDY